MIKQTCEETKELWLPDKAVITALWSVFFKKSWEFQALFKYFRRYSSVQVIGISFRRLYILNSYAWVPPRKMYGSLADQTNDY